MFFSQRTYTIGQRLIKLYGLPNAARYLRNLGVPLADAVEYLALQPTKVSK
jgi:hypothetical protein